MEVNYTLKENDLGEKRELRIGVITYNLQFQVVVGGCGVYPDDDGLGGRSDQPKGEGVSLPVRAGVGVEVVLDQPGLPLPLVRRRLWKY